MIKWWKSLNWLQQTLLGLGVMVIGYSMSYGSAVMSEATLQIQNFGRTTADVDQGFLYELIMFMAGVIIILVACLAKKKAGKNPA